MVLQAAAPLALVQLAGPGAAAAAAVVLAWVLRRQQHAPTVHGQQGTPWNSAVLELCPSLAAPYTLPRGMPTICRHARRPAGRWAPAVRQASPLPSRACRVVVTGPAVAPPLPEQC